ncbi:MAG: hypothetical protein M3N13_03165 [Candidatus Eremiobacteraeota bacterium]|nr:hypothetical protein [Candidatus Eremiobacteraeota bacterium]
MLFAALVNGGCAGQPKQFDVFPCPLHGFGGPRLVYPIPSAAGIPTAPGSLVFANRIDGIDASLVPVATSGMPSSASLPRAIVLGTFTSPPSPLPSPRATGFDSAILYAIAYPRLRSATTYEVRFTDVVSTGVDRCSFPVSPSGSFTTQ